MEVDVQHPTVENGQPKPPEVVSPTEPTQFTIVLPPLDPARTYHMRSPRLKHPEQAAEFVLKVIEEKPDAPV
jgi:hypothetical protein